MVIADTVFGTYIFFVNTTPKNPESSAFRIFSFVSAGHNIICVLARNII